VTDDLDPGALRAAEALHARTAVADLHVDTLLAVRWAGYDLRRRHRNPFPRSPFFWQADIPRWRDGGLDVLLLGVVTLPVLSAEAGCAAAADRIIDLAEACARAAPDDLALCRTAAEVRAARDAGRIAALLTLEGAHMLEGDLENLRHFHGRGVRSIGLAHFSRNSACAPAVGRGADAAAGLSDFGRALVAEMNRLGVVVDLAHVGRGAFLEACAASRRPCIVSHTGLRALHDVARNVDDAQLRAVADAGGVVGVIFAGIWLGGRGRCTSARVADHLEHAIRTIGYAHVAYGTDLDGAIVPPADVPDTAAVTRVTARLLERGHREEDVALVLGENILRVLQAVQG
jgi:membrane dipeptidase